MKVIIAALFVLAGALTALAASPTDPFAPPSAVNEARDMSGVNDARAPFGRADELDYEARMAERIRFLMRDEFPDVRRAIMRDALRHGYDMPSSVDYLLRGFMPGTERFMRVFAPPGY